MCGSVSLLLWTVDYVQIIWDILTTIIQNDYIFSSSSSGSCLASFRAGPNGTISMIKSTIQVTSSRLRLDEKSL